MLWKIRDTHLLLSVTTGADKLDKEGRKAFNKGIKKVLSGTCLVTGGSNDVETKQDDRYAIIGIVCVDRIQNKNTLKPSELTRGVFGIDSDYHLFTVDKKDQRWTLNLASLTKDNVQSDGNTNALTDDRFAVGNLVQISEDPESILDSYVRKQATGQIGLIVKVKSEGDLLTVIVGGREDEYTLNDVSLITGERWICLLKEHFKTHEPLDKNDKLVQAVTIADVQTVRAMICQAYNEFMNVENIIEYELPTDIDENQTNQQCYLDTSHDLYVFAEDSTLNEFGGEVEFRAQLEKRIASKMISEETKRKLRRFCDLEQVPVVNIVMNGDQHTLETAAYLMNEGIPSLVVKGSKGVADIIANAFENNSEPNTPTRRDVHGVDINTEIIRGMLHNSNKLFVINLLDIPDRLEDTITDVCWNGGLDVTCLVIWLLSRHRSPGLIAHFKRLVLRDTYRMVQTSPLPYELFYCIYCNDDNFLQKLLFSHTADDEECMECIDNWMYERLCEEVDGDGLLKSLRKKLYATSGKKGLGTITQVIETMKERPVRGLIPDGSVSTWWNRPATYSSKKQRNARDVLTCWDYMFIWTVLMRKNDMALMLWTKTEYPFFMAFLAKKICEAVTQQTDDQELISDMTKTMSEWSTLAIDGLNACYQIFYKKEKYATLTTTMPFWNDKSCLDLAGELSDMEFLAQQDCRSLVGEIWNGDTADINNSLAFVRPCIPVPLRKYEIKITSPKAKFAYNLISYLLFLGLFAYVLLFDLTPTVSTIEFVLMTWVLTILVEDIRQIRHKYQMPGYEKANSCVQLIGKLKIYFSEGWNSIDIFAIVMFFLGFGLRFKQFRDTFDWPRVVLAVDFFAFFVRLVHIFSIHKTLGPKIIIIQGMVHDLMYFFVIMAVVLLAYAISSYSIMYPNAPVTLETARQIVWMPYWHIYGELFLDEMKGETKCTNDVNLWMNETVPRCTSETSKKVAPFMMGVYLLFSNILLLNLLIAMFSYTFTKIHEQSDKVWCLQRYFMVKDYALRPILCPPINVFWHTYQLLQCCVLKCKRSQHSTDPCYRFNAGYLLSRHLKVALRKYRKRKENESTDSIIKTANKKLDVLRNKLEQEERFKIQTLEALKHFKALNKKVDELETKSKEEEAFRSTMLNRTNQAFKEEEDFRHELRAVFSKVQANLDALNTKVHALEIKAEGHHQVEERTHL